MVKVAEPATVLIFWDRKSPVSSNPSPGFTSCRITAPEDVDDEMLGQEFRRCFGFKVSGRATRAPTATLTTNDLVKVAEPTRVVVTWTREQPTTATCRNPRVSNPRGCAQVARDHSRCRIIAHEWIYDSTLGHELRHCFGWEHEADLKLRAR